jgi:hypothetical protein
MKTPFRILALLTKIQTGNPPKTNQKHYCLSHLAVSITEFFIFILSSS